jgi:hypothetical protein
VKSQEQNPKQSYQPIKSSCLLSFFTFLNVRF